MTYQTLIIGHRLPGVTPSEFKRRYERHMAHIREMAGVHFPLLHRRRYIQRADGENATVIVGPQADFDYDVLAEMVFENEDAAKKFYGILGEEENAKWIEQDESGFFDRNRVRLVVLGEVEVTERKA
ncbi:EthD domain-containing protein [Hypoxylon trugodes]|uniref:EthD domain-containing protein n=1 Tax=Hypoxylon trugodes TaxID=326681 RepID=UPI002192F5D2|nr:EthD domain-containing protein [Hypoxylon trugodes]KAI1392804.1 EthD domain-containing protein [Hypoxylon trugodes]